MNKINDLREFLKSGNWNQWAEIQTDQRKKIPMPSIQKAYSEKDAIKVDLIEPDSFTIGNMSFFEVINKRRSRRGFTNDFLSLEELSFLLWATQGISKENKLLRTVPSGGARHPFETYLYIQKVTDINAGLYRYLPIEHKLLFLSDDNSLAERITEACCEQDFAGECAVTFIWTTVPYRTEWRYDVLSHKVIALDAGHLCQNLYLACESINCGTCAIGAYHQEKIDNIIGVDGVDEFTIYISPVGKV